MSAHEVKRNDSRPYWPITLKFSDGSIADVSGGSVQFIARSRLDSTIKINVAAVLTLPAVGQVEWRPLITETDVAGRYYCEWEAIFSDGTKQTFPTRGYDRLKIVGDLA